MKIDKKKIATIVKSEDAENRIVRIVQEDEALVVEYISSWNEQKDLRGSVTKSAGMIVDYYREGSREIGGLILKCSDETMTSQATCLLSRDDIRRWINFDFSLDELSSRIQ